MDHNNNSTSQQPSQAGRNETLDSPGSKVADYGNPSGGAADDDVNRQRSSTDRPDEANDGRHTLGNP